MKFSLAELANITGCELVGDPEHTITNIADLDAAEQHDASFLGNPIYEKAMVRSKAGVVFIGPKDPIIEGRNFLVGNNPSRSFQELMERFLLSRGAATGFEGIHSTAVVHETASLGRGAQVGPYAVIDRDSTIGEGCIIGPHVTVGANVSIGEGSHLHAHSVVREHCQLGARVILQPGVVIGSCGFGYTNDKQGRYIKLDHLGTVTLEDDVEVGANTTIDRARFKTTRIGRGSKVDNLVQIAHGVELGEDNCIVSQVGISGSAKTGKRVIFAGQSGMAGHITVGDDIIIAGRGGVTKSLPESGKYGGIPAQPLKEYHKSTIHFRNLDKTMKRIKELERRLAALEKD